MGGKTLSAKAKIAAKYARYDRSPKGKARRKKYQQSPKGKAVDHRRCMKPSYREWNKFRMRSMKRRDKLRANRI